MTSDKTNILVERYIMMINYCCPDVVPVKNKLGSLELPHLLWMLHKMKDPTYVPLTSTDAWISWIQAGLYSAGIINIKHEVDITREILKRESYDIL